jgi:hypothetical protein
MTYLKISPKTLKHPYNYYFLKLAKLEQKLKKVLRDSHSNALKHFSSTLMLIPSTIPHNIKAFAFYKNNKHNPKKKERAKAWK